MYHTTRERRVKESNFPVVTIFASPTRTYGTTMFEVKQPKRSVKIEVEPRPELIKKLQTFAHHKPRVYHNVHRLMRAAKLSEDNVELSLMERNLYNSSSRFEKFKYHPFSS